MKKLLLTILCSISSYSYAEVNAKVYNNYIALSEPEYAPHSIPIKQQKIKFYENGMELGDDEDIKYSYDEKTKTYNYENNNFEIELDQSNNILEIKSTRNNYYRHFYYKDNTITKYTIAPSLDVYINYNKKNLVESVKRIELTPCEIISGMLWGYEKEFTYDSSNKLISMTKTKKTYIDYDITSLHIENIQYCDFSGYNENGDWLKGSCVETDDDFNIKNIAITRTIEYWE